MFTPARRLLLILITTIALTSQANERAIILQSTTSTQNSGLYDYLLPKFTQTTGIKVHVVAVGTGQAIKNAKNGDGDALLVHAKSAEENFVADGYGVERHDVMYNDFVIVGPNSDPANIRSSIDSATVLQKIAKSQAIFASRGDDSGTHKKEIQLWENAAIDPSTASGTWYRETGSGMGATLNSAVAMGAYVLTDRATWVSFKNKGRSKILFEGEVDLFNQYGVILINPKRHPNVNFPEAKAFVNWLLSKEGQAAIASFEIQGQQLFFPNANP